MRLPAQLTRIRTRLLLVNLLIVAVPLLGVGFARFYEREMLGALENDMVHQAELLATLIAARPALDVNGLLLRRVSHRAGARLRVVDASGRVTADSAGGSGARLARRREIALALSGRYGAATRLDRRRGVTMLFSALPVVTRGQVVGAVYASRSTAPVQAAMWRLRRSLFCVLGVALSITAVLTLFFAATVSRPLARLAAAARRVAAGDRRAALASTRRDEIGELARALEDMRRQLDRRAAEAAARAADLSHELKSPLTGMRGAAELLLGGQVTEPADRRRFLENIVADTERLDALVSRLLELSRVRADGEPWRWLDLRDVVREAATGGVRVRAGERPVCIRGRRAHLVSAVRNLVDNALVHRAPGTRVAVSLEARRGAAVIRVENAGEPIDPAVAGRLWERFYTTRGGAGGTGLGLPIVRAVARAHGGEATLVESGGGSTVFAIELPTRGWG